MDSSGLEKAVGRDGAVGAGAAQRLIEGQWHPISNKLWAWAPRPTILRRCAQCGFCDDCQHDFWNYLEIRYVPDSEFEREESVRDLTISQCRKLMTTKGDPKEYRYTLWAPVLLRPPHEVKGIRDAPMDLVYFIPPSPHQSAAFSAERFPLELFENLYGWNDGKLARTCRLVCRYWEQQCRNAAFKIISLGSQSRIYNLRHTFEHDLLWKHIPPLVKEVILPRYTAGTKTPWMHLLDPRWKLPQLEIGGPVYGRQTIRSIHFDLPRPLPRSMSRGITHLMLWRVDFRRFEDTICLASELLDLQQLELNAVSWESLPTNLPRRPRIHGNKLNIVKVMSCHVETVHSLSFVFAIWTLFLGVSRPSPLDSHSATHAIVKAVPSGDKFTRHDILGKVVRDSEGRIYGFEIGSIYWDGPRFLTLQYHPEGLMGRHATFTLYVDVVHADTVLLSSAVALLPQSWCLQLLFGFRNRKEMRHSMASIVDEQGTPLIGHGEVRFIKSRKEERECDPWELDYWYQASYKSRKRLGTGVFDPFDVYPDWQKALQSVNGRKRKEYTVSS